MVQWTNIKDNPGLAQASRKILRNLFRQMRGSTAFDKSIDFKDIVFKDTYWHLYKVKSNQPNELVSDSESVQSEVIATSPTPKPSLPFDLALLFSNPRFEEGLQRQIAAAFSAHISTLSIESTTCLLNHSANLEASHSRDPGLDGNLK